MIFNSLEFLVFLPIVFALYWTISHKQLKIQNIFILVSSYVFYGWWDWRFLFLLMLSTIIDYSFGLCIYNSKTKKNLLLVLSIINNLVILGFFKYYNFFVESARELLSIFDIHANSYVLEIALPIGISFYTFHGMSYVFDIYNDKIKPTKNFVDYSVFVCFFPLLVAGPIERASHLLPQVQSIRKFNYIQGISGLRLILWGLFKKIVIADTLALIVDQIFNGYGEYAGSTLLIGIIYFSIQIYCDFSGYTDIAIGVAKLLGFELLSNFQFPYFSRNIAEFWRRWHISLSSWFKDYMYIPLGGSKHGKLKAVRNTFIIFLVSGFWHGANWTYFIWGGIHACLFIPLLIASRNRKFVGNYAAMDSKFPSFREVFQMLITFCLVTFAWIFFRSPNLNVAIDYICRFHVDFLTVPKFLIGIPYVVVFVLFDWTQRRDERNVLVIKNKWFRYLIYLLLAILIIFHFNFADQQTFIYFQF